MIPDFFGKVVDERRVRILSSNFISEVDALKLPASAVTLSNT